MIVSTSFMMLSRSSVTCQNIAKLGIFVYFGRSKKCWKKED